MWYIRFLRPPQITVSSSISIEIIITVTTDLGDCFYPGDLFLNALVRSENDQRDIIQHNLVKWKAGCRCAKSQFSLARRKLSKPVHVHVTSDAVDSTLFNIISDKIPAIHAVSSGAVNMSGDAPTVDSIARRTFRFSEGSEVFIWEDIGDSIARHIWDAGVALSFHLRSLVKDDARSHLPFSSSLQSGKHLKIIELGCGCGIVGIILAHVHANCNVIMTDLGDSSKLADRNAKSASLKSSSVVSFRVLNWETSVPDLSSDGSIDAILVSDCTYNPDSSPALVRVLTALTLQSPKAMTIIAMKVRHSAELVFFDLMRSAGFIERAHHSLVLPGGAGEDGDKVDIYYFEL